MLHRAIAPGLVIAALTACNQADRVAAVWVPPAGPPTIERLRVRGTTMELEFVRLPGAADSGRDLFVARTELTWDVAELLHRKSMTKERMAELAMDGISRPTAPYGSPFHDDWGPRERRPASHLSPRQALSCAKWLAAACGRSIRLPSESEWDRLCGAAKREPIERFAWIASNSGEVAHAVGVLEADGLGLFDLQGNAAEWVVVTGEECVLKGASYLDATAALGCGWRVAESPEMNDGDPQIPKGIWWLVDAPWAGMRLVFED